MSFLKIPYIYRLYKATKKTKFLYHEKNFVPDGCIIKYFHLRTN